ncbi:MAG: M6 family metalloprotease domain-containing protein [Nitrosarchaeum sp.]
MKKFIIIIILGILSEEIFCALLLNVPQTITQPNGTIINCFATGDEFYSWLHDNNNFTIVRNPDTGYYCYAILVDNVLVASPFIVGVNDPVSSGLISGTNINLQQINSYSPMYAPAISNPTINNPKNINNLVVFIRFADQSEFPFLQSFYYDLFNNNLTNVGSMYNYFKEISYGTTNIISSFYPSNNGTTIISYKDAHIRDFYRPRSQVGDSGYVTTEYPYEGNTRTERENSLFKNALNFISNQIPSTLNLDDNNDGFIDNICFIIRGEASHDLKENILWPHQSKFNPEFKNTINSSLTHSYNVQIESEVDVSVLCHEMCHTLGAPDLYQLSPPYGLPAGYWDLMCVNHYLPASTCAYIKYKYLGFIEEIPEINVSGRYTINSLTNQSNNCFKIATSNPSEYFVLEYRKKSGIFETMIPGSGLLIYRINENIIGNLNGPPYGIYLYRPNGTISTNGNLEISNYDSFFGRNIFNSMSNPNTFLSDGSVIDNLVIKNILLNENTASFDFRLCQNTDVLLSNTDDLPEVTNAVNSILTNGKVTVKSTDNIIFEAGLEIILNSGFEVQNGGELKLEIVFCGE